MKMKQDNVSCEHVFLYENVVKNAVSDCVLSIDGPDGFFVVLY